MYRFALAIPLLLLLSVPAFAAHQTLICPECRDVQEHPKDYGNYAFNKLIEPMDDDFSIFTTYSTSTYVYNLDQQWALVSLEDVLENTGITAMLLGFNIPIQISSSKVEITVQDEYGKSTVYRVEETSKPLTVGDGTPPPPPTNPAPTQNHQLPQSSSHGGSVGTPCCQTGEFYWYYDMPEFQIQTFKE